MENAETITLTWRVSGLLCVTFERLNVILCSGQAPQQIVVKTRSLIYGVETSCLTKRRYYGLVGNPVAPPFSVALPQKSLLLTERVLRLFLLAVSARLGPSLSSGTISRKLHESCRFGLFVLPSTAS